jgi:hypothetical protein
MRQISLHRGPQDFRGSTDRREFDFAIVRWQVPSTHSHRGTEVTHVSENHPNKGPQDIGGEQAGPVDTIDHGMKFWERQANGLRSVLRRNKIVRTDELRRAAEDLGTK